MRNIIYAWSGASNLLEVGIPTVESVSTPNYDLVVKVINASKAIYLILASIAGVALLIIGTPYIYRIIETDISKFLVSWAIYSIGVIINLYYSFWNPLLKGIGAIKEANQALVISRLIYIVFTIIGLILGGGLIWLSSMYLLSGFVMRVLSKRYFNKIFTFRDSLKVNFRDVKPLLKIIWPNAKKQGIVSVGAWLITKSTTIITSYFFGLEATAQYGLSLQLLGFIGNIASLLFASYTPEIASAKINGANDRFILLFSRSITVQWVVNLIGLITVIILGPLALKIIGSNSTLLPTPYLIILSFILFLEWNHSTFATLITLTNRVPFLKSSIYSGIAIVVLALISAKFTNLGILGLIIIQGIVQLSYNNWFWPRVICKENDVSIFKLGHIGVYDIVQSIKSYKLKIRRNQK